MSTNKVVQHMGRKGYTSHNVMAVCDFDMRFIFVVEGWPGLVHGMRVFKNSMTKYRDKFQHSPEGIGLSLISLIYNPLYATNKKKLQASSTLWTQCT